MSNQTSRQVAAYYIRQRQRGRFFASQLTLHQAGLTIVGADQFNGMLTSGAMFVQDSTGAPWAALTSGVTGSTPLTGSGVINDGGVTWVQFGGKLLSAPPTPMP